MRWWLAVACVMCSGVCWSAKWPSDPLGVSFIGGDRALRYDVGHYCHMGVVYAIFSAHKQELRSTTVVWNADAGRPYRCEEFRQERERLVTEYERKVDAYYEENPLKDVRGNRHTR